MPWPKGYTKAQVREMTPEQRKEVFAKKPKEVVLTAESDRPRTESEPVPRRPRLTEVRAQKPEKKTWTMKAGNNWETMTPADESPDRYHIPRDMFPEGMDLFWATKTIYGQEMTQRLNGWQRGGWTPVHVEDFDGRFATMFSKDDGGYVVQEASILMARPLAMSIAAKKREDKKAREQIALKEQSFKGGEMPATGADHPSALATNRISRSIERIEIPKD